MSKTSDQSDTEFNAQQRHADDLKYVKQTASHLTSQNEMVSTDPQAQGGGEVLAKKRDTL